MDFRIIGLPVAPFTSLFALSDDALAARAIKRCVATQGSGYPCRVSMLEASPGESLLLLQYEHQPTASPYRAAGPIYVREAANATYSAVNTVPGLVRSRLLSVRAYDGEGMMADADVLEGTTVETAIERFFKLGDVDYLHVHNAKRGCYSCRVERA